MLYGKFYIIGNKTVRSHEKRYSRWRAKYKDETGSLVKTNRGWFIDGYEVDTRSAFKWLMINDHINVASKLGFKD